MCNNAGISSSFRRFLRDDLSDLHRVMAVNLYGVIFGSQSGARHMAAHGGGSIINTTSIGALSGGGPPIAYRTSKAAIIQFSRLIAVDLAEYGIRVNCIAPGHIPTEITSYDIGPVIRVHQPLQRQGSPEDVANAVLFLASDRAGADHGDRGPRRRWDDGGPSVAPAEGVAGGNDRPRPELSASLHRPDRSDSTSSRTPTLPNRLLDQLDHPSDAPDGPLLVDLPVDDQSLVGRDAPEHVEHRGSDRLFLGRPLGCVCCDGAEQRIALALVRLGEGRIERRSWFGRDTTTRGRRCGTRCPRCRRAPSLPGRCRRPPPRAASPRRAAPARSRSSGRPSVR